MDTEASQHSTYPEINFQAYMTQNRSKTFPKVVEKQTHILHVSESIYILWQNLYIFVIAQQRATHLFKVKFPTIETTEPRAQHQYMNAFQNKSPTSQNDNKKQDFH